MPNCFLGRGVLINFTEGLLAAGGARSAEVKRLALELVSELTSDGSSTLTAADLRGGVAFVPDALDPSAANDERGKRAAGIA